MSTTLQTDRIERKIMINDPRARVWRALTNPDEFGTWFGVDLKGPSFESSQRIRGLISCTAIAA
jgi:uncharacterized protein YndB with AHSA1/START domain